MEPRISIITLGVANLERSYDFYYKALGFPTSGYPQAGIIFSSSKAYVSLCIQKTH